MTQPSSSVNCPSTFDASRPIAPELLDILPLHRWPSRQMAREFFMEQSYRILLAHDSLPESADELEAITRSAWRSAGLLVRANPKLSYEELREHVEKFLVMATSRCCISQL